MRRIYHAVLMLACCFASAAVCGKSVRAEDRVGVVGLVDARNKPEVTICSQNLENYGSVADMRLREPGTSAESLAERSAMLVKRIVKADCDVIAVQEVLGRDEASGKKALEQLALSLRHNTGRIYNAVVGPTNDHLLRVGYLVAVDRASIVNRISYVNVELPKISSRQKPRMFPRGPLEVQLEVKPRGQDSITKVITLVTFHFKSKAGKSADPAGLEYETWRMEMAEALRRIIEKRHHEAFDGSGHILVVLGDRNSNFDVASAMILEGKLALRNFQEKSGVCRLSKRGVPLCPPLPNVTEELFSVLLGDPHVRNKPGTFVYRGAYSWLDEILLPPDALRFAYENPEREGEYASGVIYEPKGASDHAMVYVRLNW